MTISADLKNRNDSARFFLVKITPAYWPSTTDWVSAGSSVYYVDLPNIQYVETVTRLGVDMSPVSAAPTNDGEYYWDEGARRLTIKSTLGGPSSNNVPVIVFFNLYFSSDVARVVGDDPASPTANLRTWEPRVIGFPQMSQLLENVALGVFSLSDTAITLANADGALHPYLGKYYSFHNKDVRVWLCVNDVSNLSKFYIGKMKSVSGDAESVTFTMFDAFANLNAPALMGDDYDECYVASSTFANLDPKAQGGPIPLILSQKTPFIGGGDFYPPDIEFQVMNKAVCTSYSTTKSTSANREWAACRILDVNMRQLNFGTVKEIRSYNLLATLERVEIKYTSANQGTHNLRLGDTFKLTYNGTDLYCCVIVVNEPATGGDVIVLCESTLIDGEAWGSDIPMATSPGSVTLHQNRAPTVWLREGKSGRIYRAYYERDFTYSETATAGGNKLLEITFVNDFESKHKHEVYGGPFRDMEDILSPDSFEVGYAIETEATDDLKAARVIKKMFDAVGIPVNSSSFTSPSLSVAAYDVQMQIPRKDETEYGTYIDYMGKILSCFLGVVFLNESFEAELAFAAVPSSSDEVNANHLIDGGTFAIEYQDAVTSIIAYNDYLPQDSVATTNFQHFTKYLHGINNPTKFVHVMASTDGVRANDIFYIRSRGVTTYTFKTATKHLEASIGDDLRLRAPVVVGGSGSAQLKIIGITKTADGIEITAQDMGTLED